MEAKERPAVQGKLSNDEELEEKIREKVIRNPVFEERKNHHLWTIEEVSVWASFLTPETKEKFLAMENTGATLERITMEDLLQEKIPKGQIYLFELEMRSISFFLQSPTKTTHKNE